MKKGWDNHHLQTTFLFYFKVSLCLHFIRELSALTPSSYLGPPVSSGKVGSREQCRSQWTLIKLQKFFSESLQVSQIVSHKPVYFSAKVILSSISFQSLNKGIGMEKMCPENNSKHTQITKTNKNLNIKSMAVCSWTSKNITNDNFSTTIKCQWFNKFL